MSLMVDSIFITTLCRVSTYHLSGYHVIHFQPDGPLSLPHSTIIEMLRVKTTNHCTIHPSKTLKTYETLESGSIRLRFTDGTESETDVLVGCDGVHSATRTAMFSQAKTDRNDLLSYIKPVFSGTLAYRSSVDLNVLKSKYPDHPGLTHPKIVSATRICLVCTH